MKEVKIKKEELEEIELSFEQLSREKYIGFEDSFNNHRYVLIRDKDQLKAFDFDEDENSYLSKYLKDFSLLVGKPFDFFDSIYVKKQQIANIFGDGILYEYTDEYLRHVLSQKPYGRFIIFNTKEEMVNWYNSQKPR